MDPYETTCRVTFYVIDSDEVTFHKPTSCGITFSNIDTVARVARFQEIWHREYLQRSDLSDYGRRSDATLRLTAARWCAPRSYCVLTSPHSLTLSGCGGRRAWGNPA